MEYGDKLNETNLFYIEMDSVKVNRIHTVS